jgi:hypothetical protein
VTVEILSWESQAGRFGTLESKSYERRPPEGFVRIDEAAAA